MMKRIYEIPALLLITALMLYGCGSDRSSKAESLIKTQVDVTENYVNGMSSAESPEDVVKVIESYTEGMKKLIPEIKEFQNKYPEYQQGKIPDSMKNDMKRLEEISARIPEAMMKITSYLMNEKVQSAMQKMGEEMSELH